MGIIFSTELSWAGRNESKALRVQFVFVIVCMYINYQALTKVHSSVHLAVFIETIISVAILHIKHEFSSTTSLLRMVYLSLHITLPPVFRSELFGIGSMLKRLQQEQVKSCYLGNRYLIVLTKFMNDFH